MIKIVIDDTAGYCFGVRNAIKQSEAILEEDEYLYSLGHIVHNETEVNRLKTQGLEVIDHEQLKTLKNSKVLIRAHGEPPSTYETAYKNNIVLIDATCPIVKHLQKNISERTALNEETNSQVVIYGKKDHPEVIGLVGHAEGNALVIATSEDIKNINPGKDVHLYAQTTMNPENFAKLAEEIRAYLTEYDPVNSKQVFEHNTICRQVSNRVEGLKRFASTHDLLLFVSGRQSSNGKFLFSVCKEVNPNSYHIENKDDINKNWFENIKSVGISGATSTPTRQLSEVADFLKDFLLMNETL